MDEATIERIADRLIELYRMEWDATWHIKGYCAELVEHYTEQEIRAIAKAARMSHRTIFNNAVVAQAYPEEQRVECLSPRSHAIWHGKDQRKKEEA